jgi:hypothetical protein
MATCDKPSRLLSPCRHPATQETGDICRHVAMSPIYKRPTPVGAPLASAPIAFTVKIAMGAFGNRRPDFSVITSVCCRDAISSISI